MPIKQLKDIIPVITYHLIKLTLVRHLIYQHFLNYGFNILVLPGMTTSMLSTGKPEESTFFIVFSLILPINKNPE
ncbi:MAG: hypothetical protein HY756_04140 [Nitrospirae bacterium]|nr:hypothetical protein [Nitrospirota bacterium]